MITSTMIAFVEFFFLNFQLRNAIEKDIKEFGLKPHPTTVLKVIQLYETKNSRYHGLQ